MAGLYSDISGALKEAYPSKALEPMVNDETKFRKTLKRNVPAGSKMSGGLVKFGAILHTPENYAQIADGDTLLSPKDRTQTTLSLKPTIFTGGFTIGWMAKAVSGSKEVSWTNGGEVRQRVEETVSNLGKYMEQTYIAGDGSSKRAEVASATSNLSWTAAQPWGVRLLRVNQLISCRTTPGGNTVGGTGSKATHQFDGARITDINPDTLVVTMADHTATGGTETPTAGYHISLVSSGFDTGADVAQTGLSSIALIGSAATGVTANGLRGLVDDGTYAQFLHGVDRTAAGNYKLKSVVKGAGGVLRNLTEQILINTVHTIREKLGKPPRELWCNTGQVEKYIEFVAPDRRYNISGNGTQGKGTGYQEGELVHYAPGVALKFNVSVDMLPREIFLLNWDAFFLYQSQELDWWDNPMLKPTPVAGGFKASYQAHMAAIENVGIDMPMSCGVIRDLKDPLCGD